MHCNVAVMVFACWKVHFPSVNISKAGAILAGLVFNEIICKNIYGARRWGLTPLWQGTVPVTMTDFVVINFPNVMFGIGIILYLPNT